MATSNVSERQRRRFWHIAAPDWSGWKSSFQPRKHTFSILVACLLVMALSIPVATLLARGVQAAPGPGDWPMYLHDVEHSAISNDTIINVANAPQLTKRWGFKTNGGIAAQPMIVDGIVYIGSWDGFEYALDANTGAQKWKTDLGQTIAPNCIPGVIGVTSSATISNGVLYVGGGDRYWYALNANTGAVLWRVDTGDNSAQGGHYNWSSPLIVNGFAYIGIASNCDEPLVQGKLLKVDLTTHQVVGTLNLVNDGEVGGGIWTTPAIDVATNTIYMTTGTISLTTQTYAQAMIAIDATTLAVKGSWQIPFDQAGIDLDWGTSPTLFKDANGRKMVAAANKDGIFYAFDAANITAGPVWQTVVAETGSCPPCGNGSVSTGTLGGGLLYIAGGNTAINGRIYPGGIHGLDPTTGTITWERGTANPIIPALAYSNGMVIDGAGPMLEVRNATNGDLLYTYYTAGLYSAPSVANGQIYVGALDGTIYAFALPNPAPPPPPADPNCPANWTCQPVGNPNPIGTETIAGGNWTVTTGGAGAGGVNDQFRFISRPVNGNTQISARVTAQPATAGVSQTGLMLRQNTDANSPYYAIFATPNKGLTVQYRAAFGGNTAVLKQLNTAQLPLYLALQRVGDQIQAATSNDGVTYTLVPGSTANIVFPTISQVGLAVSSGVNGVAGNATFTNITVGAPGVMNAPPLLSPCPAGWICGDVANPMLQGDQALANGVWTLKAGGTEINNYRDQFHYVWQNSNGDTTVSTHITAQDNTSPGAKAGVIFRTGTDPGAPYYGVFVTPQQGIIVQYRLVLGANTIEVAKVAGQAPAYLRVARWHDSFTAYTSVDGINWTPIDDSTVVLNFPIQLQAGLALTSANAGTLGTVTMNNVAVVANAPVAPVYCPDNWSCADIANSVPTGSESLVNGVWKIRAGGSDIWGLADQFHYDWQTLAADGSISGHFTGLTNTDPWAKAGIMLRQGAGAQAAYYGAFVSAGNGVVVQYRLTAKGPSTQILAPGITDTYLKVARAGTIFTTYSSPDGVNWTAIPGSSIRLGLTGPVLAGLAVTAHTTAGRTTATIDTVVLATTATPPPNNCPANWSCFDIGDPLMIGEQTLTNGVWKISGGGTDIWGVADQFRYIWQNLAADGTATAHITAQTNTDPWAKTGVMLRQSTDAGSAYYAVFVTQENGVTVQYRTALGAGTTQLTYPGTVPAYLRVARSGTTFTAYTSTDGITWTPLANSSVRIAGLTGPLFGGVAVTSHSNAAINTATLDGITVADTSPQPPDPPCPTPWTCADIGAPSIIGNQTVNNGVWTLQGGGNDIWGTADQFHYAWQAITADGTVRTRVTAQNNTDPWAKTGVMLRQSTEAGSPYYAFFVTHDHGLAIQYRSDQGGATTQILVAGAVPAYLQVARSGATFTAYTSNDGVNWTAVANSSLNIDMGGTILAGLAVNSHNDGYIATVTMDHVAILATAPPPPAPACPNGWSCGEVGNPHLVGSQTLVNGTWTIQGSGGDIWGAADQFHYDWQGLNGDGTISAHITTQTYTDPWAKAGVMLRQDTAVDSPYYAIFATPDNGLAVQYRTVRGGATTSVVIPGNVPTYLRVVRAGTTFTAYTSQNGINWTPVAGSAVVINMPAQQLVGLAVTSHNNTVLSTATFDGVVVG